MGLRYTCVLSAPTVHRCCLRRYELLVVIIKPSPPSPRTAPIIWSWRVLLAARLECASIQKETFSIESQFIRQPVCRLRHTRDRRCVVLRGTGNGTSSFLLERTSTSLTSGFIKLSSHPRSLPMD